MRLDLKSDNCGRAICKVLLLCLCIHGVKRLACEKSTMRQMMQ